MTDNTPKIELRYVPPMSNDRDEESYLLRVKGITEWKLMTRAEIEEQYPDILRPKNA